MSKHIIIDPWTEKNITERATESFEEVLTELLADAEDEIYEEMYWAEVAKLFFFNGYIRGAVDMSKDEKFRDDIELMNDEIDYQNK